MPFLSILLCFSQYLPSFQVNELKLVALLAQACAISATALAAAAAAVPATVAVAVLQAHVQRGELVDFLVEFVDHAAPTGGGRRHHGLQHDVRVGGSAQARVRDQLGAAHGVHLLSRVNNLM